VDSTLGFIFVLIVIWVVLNTLYALGRGSFEKYGLKLYYGVILVWRIKKEFPQPRLYRKLSYVSIPLYALALYGFYDAVISSILVKLGLIKGSAIQILVPGINVFGVEAVYLIIAVATAATIHELMHAYTARAHGLKINSLGIAVLFIIPVAFTELDEESLCRASKWVKTVVLSAGPAVNMALALIFLYLSSFMVAPAGLVIYSVEAGGLAEKYGLEPGYILLEVNGEHATIATLSKYVSNPNESYIELVINSGDVIKHLLIHKPANVTKLGMRVVSKPIDPIITAIGVKPAVNILLLTMWMYIVNFSLALINAAPLFITDGGRITYELTKKRFIGHIINAVSLSILICGIAPLT